MKTKTADLIAAGGSVRLSAAATPALGGFGGQRTAWPDHRRRG